MELKDGNLVLDVEDMLAATGYNLVVTPADEDDEAEPLLVPAYHEIYEAEDAELSAERLLPEAADITAPAELML